MRGFEVNRHNNANCPDIEHLCTFASTEGHGFVERTRQEWLAGANRFRRRGECFFVASTPNGVIGMCGLNIDPYVDDPGVGRLRHLYVLPEHRRAGVGLALVNACRDVAAESFDRVRLRTHDPAASAFYCSIGFSIVDEPDATHSWCTSSGPA